MNDRDHLLQQLSLYKPIDNDDTATLNQFIDFVRSEKNCFQRQNEHGHITASAWTIAVEQNSVLLIHHRKLGKWLQPGGHADGDSNLRAVAQRELHEETGIFEISSRSCQGECEIFDIDIHLIPATEIVPTKTELSHFHYDVRFLFHTSLSHNINTNSESTAVTWVKLEDLESYTNEHSLHRMRKKYYNYLNSRENLSPSLDNF